MKTTKNRPRWVTLYGLAHAYAEGTCDHDKIGHFEASFTVRANQVSYTAACWGALGGIGERVSADLLRTLLACCPVRRTTVACVEAKRPVALPPVLHTELDLGNAVLDDVQPDFVALRMGTATTG